MFRKRLISILLIILLIIFTFSGCLREKQSNNKSSMDNTKISIEGNKKESKTDNNFKKKSTAEYIINYSPVAIGDEVIITTNDGKVYRIGDTKYYERETDEYIRIWDKAIEVDGLEDIISVYANRTSYFALDNYGNVWAWGNNSSGELGLGSTKFIETPTIVEGGNDVVHITFEVSDTFFLTKNNYIMTCGHRQGKPVFEPTYLNQDIVNNVKDIRGNIVLKNDGTIYTLEYGYYRDLKLKKIEISDSIVTIYDDYMYSYGRAENGFIYLIEGFKYNSIGVPPKVKLPSNAVEMSESGNMLITVNGEIMLVEDFDCENVELNDIAYIYDISYHSGRGNSGVAIDEFGTGYKYETNDEGLFISLETINIVKDIGPVNTVYKDQEIGQEGQRLGKVRDPFDQ